MPKGVKESLAVVLHQLSAMALKKRRGRRTEEREGFIAEWYRRCCDEARREAGAGKREARVATGYSTPLSVEDKVVLDAVAKKLRKIDKLRVRREVVKSDWVSDDTGLEFTKTTLVIVLNW